MSKELIVGDYMFANLEEANVAKLELEKINKLNEKLVNADVDILIKVYNKSIEKGTFRTPVGLDYMKKLKGYMEKAGVKKTEILPIPVNMPINDKVNKEETSENLKKYKQAAAKNSAMFKWSLFINIVLVVVIIALFVITSTSKNPNILNYENAILDKYSSWEEELTQREKAVREKEAELNIQYDE